MTSAESTATEGRGGFTRRDSVVAWFQYAGLWALVVAWPVYQSIASGPEALTGVGARRLDLAVLVALISLVVPTGIYLFEVLVRRLGSIRAAEIFRAVVLGGLIALLAWQQLVDSGSAGILRLLLPVLVWGLVSFAYLRLEFARNFAEILGVAAPVVIIAFFLRYPIQSEVLPHESGTDYAQIEADTPVVIVIFDEFPLASLESGPAKIDSKLFPRFAALADTSSWYPDAIAVADQTTSAVPAILTGKTPDDKAGAKPTPPGLPDYPDSICSLARKGGYEIFAYEPITDICSRSYGLPTRVSTLINRGVFTTQLVPGPLESKVAGAVIKPFRKPWGEYNEDRPAAVDAFIEGLPEDGRSISVLHIALPHLLWEYMPDGTRYNPETFPEGDGVVPGGSGANVLLQQMLLQVGYTDSELGRIIDRMKADGTWDDSLMVVTADHGASFKPGSSRRILTQDNLGWNLPVPLFIKYPGQTKGEVVPGAVDSRDITPTVLDVLGGEPAPDASGRSLAGGNLEPASGPVEAKGYSGEVEVSRTELDRQLERARRQRNRTFGGGELFALGGHRGLLGKKSAEVPGLEPVAARIFNPELYQAVDLDSEVLPSYLRAELLPAPGEKPHSLAVSVNGRIAATAVGGKLFERWFTGITLPSSAFRNGSNDIEFLEIPR